MELWKETINKVYLEGDSGWTPTATYAKDGVSAGSLSPTWNTTDLRFEATLPYILDECTVTVTWTFSVPGTGSIVKTDSYEIITPLLTKREIRKVWDDSTDDEVLEIEAAVRYIIQAHTGQVFGKRNKSLVVPGAGESALALPERLISITGLKTLSAILNPSSLAIVADGWYLKKRYTDALSDIPNDSVYWDGEGDYAVPEFPEEAPHGLGHVRDRFGHGQIIANPRNQYTGTTWREDYPFTITGAWGYNVVPSPVKEAAKLLINDYACSEQMYRDRYLDSIKSADWRLQYNAQAFLQTGNVRADQLLSDFVMKRGWALI